MLRLTSGALDLLHAMVGRSPDFALTTGCDVRAELLALQCDDTKSVFEIAADLATFTVRRRPFGYHSPAMAWLICDTLLRINGEHTDLPELFVSFLVKDLQAGRLGPKQFACALQDTKFWGLLCA